MLPYTVVVLILWIILFVIWFLLGIPLGPGYPGGSIANVGSLLSLTRWRELGGV